MDLRLVSDRETILNAIEWLERLMFDHEYDQCGGCRCGSYLGLGKGRQKEHDPGCELKATVDALKRLAGSAGEKHAD